MKTEIQINGVKRAIEFDRSRMEFAVDGRQIIADAVPISAGTYSILLNGRSFDVTVEKIGGSLMVRVAGREFQVEILDPRSWRRARVGSIELEGRQQLAAPMPGKIVRVLAVAGEKVEAGQGLLVIEAMKMQNEIRSPKSGTLERIAQEGKTVTAGEILAIVT
jgi:biotin carboxyl carrier protein